MGLFAIVLGVLLAASGFLEGETPGSVHPVTVAAWVVGYGGVVLGLVLLSRTANRGARGADAGAHPGS